jgi:hypothetical protein
MSDPAPNRRWLPVVRELFLVVVAIVCAFGWASEHQANSRLASFPTVEQCIKSMGDDDKQVFVDCRREGDDIARYWLVRERPSVWTDPAPVYVPSREDTTAP